ncbi:MAG: DUF1722 domain-containing protein [Pseudomonadaceae bacterium]|nr:MAG: DUF1722 domain-containing protein [Pseudomonadaceae bacterium]
MVDSQRIPIGISQCLLGSPVRFNGGHKHSRLCTVQLGDCFDLVPFCPEVSIGLGTPREPIRLVGEPSQPRVVGSKTPTLDVTDDLRSYGRKVADEQTHLCGFILMQKSPSCGMERVKVYQSNGHPAQGTAAGAFAAELMRQRPLLPVEEEGRLHDPVLRENFVTRVMVYAAWQQLLAEGLDAKRLLKFHARHKYLLLAHHPQHYQRMGHLLANLAAADLPHIADSYFELLMVALKKVANRGSHSNVLAHIAGHFKRVLSSDERQELETLITDYRQGQVPLVVPLTLLKHHLMKHPDDYLHQQAYLQPHPPGLSLRNAI